MHNVIVITFFVYLFFSVEFFLFNFIHPLLMPNLLLIAVIFFNLLLGIRYSLLAAILAGLLKDSYGTHPFGIHIFSFILCAYLTTFFKKYIYQGSSPYSKLVLISSILSCYLLIQYTLYSMSVSISFIEALEHVFLPTIVTTLLMANTTIRNLKKCVLKLSVS